MILLVDNSKSVSDGSPVRYSLLTIRCGSAVVTRINLQSRITHFDLIREHNLRSFTQKRKPDVRSLIHNECHREIFDDLLGASGVTDVLETRLNGNELLSRRKHSNVPKTSRIPEGGSLVS